MHMQCLHSGIHMYLFASPKQITQLLFLYKGNNLILIFFIIVIRLITLSKLLEYAKSKAVSPV